MPSPIIGFQSNGSKYDRVVEISPITGRSERIEIRVATAKEAMEELELLRSKGYRNVFAQKIYKNYCLEGIPDESLKIIASNKVKEIDGF